MMIETIGPMTKQTTMIAMYMLNIVAEFAMDGH
jgi:hypothetical protein